jgi:hypothetical protein
MSMLKELDKTRCKVGTRVQDRWGDCGTVQWIGKLDKNPPPPAGGPTNATYAAVLFDRPIAATSRIRTDGVLNGVRLATGLPGQVGFIQPKNLYAEVMPQAIGILRSQMGAKVAHLEDEILEKFLIARRFEIPLVVTMLEEHLKWVAEFKPRTDEYYPPGMAQEYPVGGQAPPATDYEGNLIRVMCPGNRGAVAPKAFVARWGIPLIMRWHATDMFQWLQDLRNTQWRSRRFCVMIDLKDMGESDTNVLAFAKGLNKIDQGNFPETVYRMLIVNAPSVFAVVWRLVRVVVDDRTKEKIQIFSVSDTKKGAVNDFIDPQYQPTFLPGGMNDSWMRDGGIVGSKDPSKAVDPATLQAIAAPDLNDPEIAAAMAQGMETTPIVASPTYNANAGSAASPK